jgi:hypothetical protein
VSLRELIVTGNRMGDDGAALLGEALASNGGLHQLMCVGRRQNRAPPLNGSF